MDIFTTNNSNLLFIEFKNIYFKFGYQPFKKTSEVLLKSYISQW